MRGRRWAFRGPAMITGSANLYYTLAISLLPLPFFMGAPLFPSFLFYLPFFSLRPPFLRRVTLSLSLSLSPSSFLLSLSKPTALGLIRDRSQEEDRYLHFLRTNRAFLPLRLRPLVGERKVSRRKREREIVGRPATRGLYPLSSIQSRELVFRL